MWTPTEVAFDSFYVTCMGATLSTSLKVFQRVIFHEVRSGRKSNVGTIYEKKSWWMTSSWLKIACVLFLEYKKTSCIYLYMLIFQISMLYIHLYKADSKGEVIMAQFLYQKDETTIARRCWCSWPRGLQGNPATSRDEHDEKERWGNVMMVPLKLKIMNWQSQWTLLNPNCKRIQLGTIQFATKKGPLVFQISVPRCV